MNKEFKKHIYNMKIPVSVGICAYNEENNIGNVLSLLHNTKLRGFRIIEILVATDGCTDRTVDIVKEWKKKDKRIKLLVGRKRKGKIAALNKIMRKCKGKIFMIIDADQYFNKNSIQLVLNRLKNDEVGAVSARRVCIFRKGGNKNFTEKVVEALQKLIIERERYSILKNKFECGGGGILAFKKELCTSIPKSVINDDAYIAAVCKKKGYKSLIERRARAYVNPPKILIELINMRRRHIYGNLMIEKETKIEPPKLVSGFWTYFLIILKFFLKEKLKGIVYFFTGYFVEFCANILARIDLCRKNNPHVTWKIAKTTKRKVIL